MWQSKVEESNWVIWRTPLFPFTRFSQNDFKSIPIGETTPMPVTTTRRLLMGSRYGVSLQYAVKQHKFEPEIDSGVSGTHPDHLDLLKEFSFGSDGWRNDDLRLLELSEVGSTDVSHASCHRSDQILTAIIHVCGTEQDLSQ